MNVLTSISFLFAKYERIQIRIALYKCENWTDSRGYIFSKCRIENVCIRVENNQKMLVKSVCGHVLNTRCNYIYEIFNSMFSKE